MKHFIILCVVSWAVAASASAQECAPACRAGYVCQAGQCVSACNPACDAGTSCTQSATGFACVANAPPPPPQGYAAPPGYAAQGSYGVQPGGTPYPPMHRVHVEDGGLVVAGWVTFGVSYALSIPIWFLVTGLYGGTAALAAALAFVPFVNGASTLFIGTVGQIIGVILLIIGYVGHDQDVPMGMARIGDVTLGVTPIAAPNTGGLAVTGSF